MKFSILTATTLLLASGLVDLATAGCVEFWEGTAPFCDSKCPEKLGIYTCEGTGRYSTRGNGGKCWTGKKQVCRCCANTKWVEEVCVNPTKSKTKCVGLVLMCSRIGVKKDGSEVVCSVYACGACFFA
ncbi:hypothetical protein TWF718_001508 [Orbilia javanica]|uniref:Uncharacterized protein n=1 Tax=Orbilia javanica TaxID=47235 RepID=A0AAN8NHU5_9PEZI